jgi:hypothetical protein
VEEIPSARQPIAGVGTSTAGFIGLVPKTILVPVPNPDYDSVVANAALRAESLRKKIQESGGAAGTNATTARLDQQMLDKQIDKLTQDLRNKNDEVKKAEADAAKAKTKLEKAEEAIGPANQTLEQKDKDLADLQAQPEPKPEDVAKATKERDAARSEADRLSSDAQKLSEKFVLASEVHDKLQVAAKNLDDQIKALASNPATQPPPTPDDSLTKSSFLRPYILKEVAIKVGVCDTKLCTNFSEYEKRFGTFSAYSGEPTNGDDSNPERRTFKPMFAGHSALTNAVNGFFLNGGTRCYVARIEDPSQLPKALKAFGTIGDVAIIAAPGLDADESVWVPLIDHCEDDNHENVFAILDSPLVAEDNEGDLDLGGLPQPRPSKNAAYYFPWIEVVDPAKQLQDSDPARQIDTKYRGRTYAPTSGHMAGIYARTDNERGVHKAPANCVVRGAVEVKYYIGKAHQENLNPKGINAIRLLNDAVTVWGARTNGGDRNMEWKYINVRRLFLYLQESIDGGTQWVVFEPNDNNLWSKIRLNVSAFLTNVWRSGALFGLTPEEAFYVKCDAETNPPEVRDLGQVITEIGVAIVRPAEFVIFRITQSTGQQPA